MGFPPPIANSLVRLGITALVEDDSAYVIVTDFLKVDHSGTRSDMPRLCKILAIPYFAMLSLSTYINQHDHSKRAFCMRMFSAVVVSWPAPKHLFRDAALALSSLN